jgi:hypothetical protein
LPQTKSPEKCLKRGKTAKFGIFRDFRDKTRNSAIYINFREKSRKTGVLNDNLPHHEPTVLAAGQSEQGWQLKCTTYEQVAKQ